MSDIPKRKGGKPANADLLAERKAIAELLADLDGETNLERVQAALEFRRLYLELKRTAKLDPRLSDPGPPLVAVMPVPPVSPASHHALPVAMPSPAPGVVIAPEGPWQPEPTRDGYDRAHYPTANEPQSVEVQFRPSDKGPPQSAVLGDLTPQYARWYVGSFGPDKAREKYDGRIHELPLDLQSALS